MTTGDTIYIAAMLLTIGFLVGYMAGVIIEHKNAKTVIDAWKEANEEWRKHANEMTKKYENQLMMDTDKAIKQAHQLIEKINKGEIR